MNAKLYLSLLTFCLARAEMAGGYRKCGHKERRCKEELKVLKTQNMMRGNLVEGIELSPTRRSNSSNGPHMSRDDAGMMLANANAIDAESSTNLQVTESTRSRPQKRYLIAVLLIVALIGIALGIILWRVKSEQQGGVGERGDSRKPTRSPVGCYQKFLSSFGNFSSPGFPTRLIGTTCRYQITVPFHQGVLVNFHVFSLPKSVACKYNAAVEIYEDGALKARLCGSGLKTFQSYSNSINVVFKADSSFASEYSGFQATFIATRKACNYTVNLASPYFSTPRFGIGKYPSDIECHYFFESPVSKLVSLLFLHLDIEYGKYCAYDSVKVYDNKTLVQTLCGKSYTYTPWISKSNRVAVVFRVDGSISGKGFRAKYSEVSRSCFQTFTSESGSFFFSFTTISSFPDGCMYRIKVPRDKGVNIDFKELNLPEDCLKASVVIYEDNPRPYYKTEKAVLCGRGPRMFQSFSNDVYIAFRSTPKSFPNLFATYSATKKVCNYTVEAESPRFSSPNYPSNYPSNLYCQYYIKVDYGKVVVIEFEEIFLQWSQSCASDALMIYEDGIMRDRFCGYLPRKRWYSTGSSVTVVLKSDTYITRSGFFASYRSEKKYFNELLQSNSGSFSSPGFPVNYSSNMQYSYYIIVPNGKGIRVHFDPFSLQQSKRCVDDYVQIYELSGGSFNSKELACGNGARSFKSYSNRLFVAFRSSSSMSGRFQGFNATFSSIKQACSYSLTETSPRFASPGYPDQYPVNISCQYHIKVPLTKAVRIHFETFLLQGGEGCPADSVKIYENGLLQETLCGNKSKTVWESQGSEVLMLFESDASFTSKGLDGYVTTILRPVYHTFTTIVGNFSSPGYPGGYPKDSRWIYHLKVPSRKGIKIDFPVFFLPPSANCQNDSVRIYEGNKFSRSLKAVYCGKGARSFHSYSENVYVELRSSSIHSSSHQGFHAIFRASMKACDYKMTGSSGTFASPGYPHVHAVNITCNYQIEVEAAKAVEIIFSRLSTISQDDYTCRSSEIKIYEDSILMKTLDPCRFPVSWKSRGNRPLVIYRSEIAGVFFASYRKVEKPCWHVMNSSYGKFSSPGFPDKNPSTDQCIYEITVPTGKGVKVNFPMFTLPEASPCYANKVEIYEENTEFYNSKAVFCGKGARSYHSYSNKVFVLFQVSLYQGKQPKHFSATFEASQKACNYTITDGAYYFTSPGYPNKNSGDVKCHYRIQAPYDRAVALTFREFSLHNGTLCSNGSLTVSENNFFVKHFCERTGPFKWTSRGSAVSMVFNSGASSTSSGFYGYYATATKACYKSYESEAGSFTSPGFPDQYPSNATCEYLITVEEQRIIDITFVRFDVQYDDECEHDSVQIFDATDSSKRSAAKFCGTGKKGFRSKGNRVLVRFLTDSSISRSGFAAEYHSLRVIG